MQVVILAGGLGTRIRSVSGGLPKSLVPVGGRPFLEHQFDLLARGGFREALLCIGHLGERIRRHVGDGSRFGLRVAYSKDPPGRPLGTGGALVRALPRLRDEFLVLYGDSYLQADTAAFAAAFRSSGAPAMMAVYRNRNRWDRSNVRIRRGRVVSYDKQAPAGSAEWIDYGLLALRREVLLAHRRDPAPLDLAPVLAGLAARGELAAWIARRRFYEIGRPEGLEALERRLRREARRAAGPAASR